MLPPQAPARKDNAPDPTLRQLFSVPLSLKTRALQEPGGPKPSPRGGPHLSMLSSTGFGPKRQNLQKKIAKSAPAQGFSLALFGGSRLRRAPPVAEEELCLFIS